MMVGFEPTPEDWCLKPAPLVAHRSLDHSATSSTCAIVTGFERALIGENQSCDPYGSRFQVYRLNHSATLSCTSPIRGETDAGVEPATFRFSSPSGVASTAFMCASGGVRTHASEEIGA